MTCGVTGATGFIGAHVAKLASESGGPVRETYRIEARLEAEERVGRRLVAP